MFTKWIKTSILALGALALIGGLFFGKDLLSYVRSSAKSVQSAVKGSVPIEFELGRARDLLDEIIPEMHANIRLIAQEEVEVAHLKSDIAASHKHLEDQKQQLTTLRRTLDLHQTSYTFGERQFTRNEVNEDLTRRFEQFKEAELVLAGKQRLLIAREKSLAAAAQLLDRTRSRKLLLEDKIESLASQHRLVKAAAVGSAIQVDNSKLAQTEKLITQIKKRLDVAERVLAHESRFVESIPLDTIDEKDLLSQIDEYFNPTNATNPTCPTNAANTAVSPEKLPFIDPEPLAKVDPVVPETPLANTK